MFKDWDVEIDQQPERFVIEFEVRDQLGLVDRLKFGDSFELHNQRTSNHKIEPIATIEAHLFITDRERPLSLEAKPSLRQFIRQAFFIRTLQQSGSKLPMNFDAQANYFAAQFIQSLSFQYWVCVVHLVCLLVRNHRHRRFAKPWCLVLSVPLWFGFPASLIEIGATEEIMTPRAA